MSVRELSVLVFCVCFLVTPLVTVVISQSTQEFSKTGPFVDGIVYRQYAETDQMVSALLDDSVDVVGIPLGAQYLGTLQGHSYVDVAPALMDFYVCAFFRCTRYPLNISAFRRAVALALDKNAMVSSVIDGGALPIDSFIPRTSPLSAENRLGGTYYEAHVDEANDLLDTAGFVDANDDGYRDAPDGTPFHITIDVGSDTDFLYDTADAVGGTLEAISIDVKVDHSPPSGYLSQWWTWFDIRIWTCSYSTPSTSPPATDERWYVDELSGDLATDRYRNIAGYTNAVYDSLRDSFVTAPSFEAVSGMAEDLQSIILQDCPIIPLFEPYTYVAHRTNRFEGLVSRMNHGALTEITNRFLRLRTDQGGPLGGTFRWAIGTDIDTFNPMASSVFDSLPVFRDLYDSLFLIGPDGSPVPWLCTDYLTYTHADDEAVPEGAVRFVFHLFQNVTWSDGTPVTAEDVSYSINFYYEAEECNFHDEVRSLQSTLEASDYTLIVEFYPGSYWNLVDVGMVPILPKATLSSLTPEDYASWDPNPLVDDLITGGPFFVTVYQPGTVMQLVRYDGYFRAPQYTVTSTYQPTETTETFSYSPGEGASAGVSVLVALVIAVAVASVITVIGGYFVVRR